ncbi:Helix-turn-helix domain protein [compost metagenome]
MNEQRQKPFEERTYLSVKQVARMLRKKEDTVRGYIRSGRLSAFSLGKDYLIQPEWVEQFVEEAYASGRTLRKRSKGGKVAQRNDLEGIDPTKREEADESSV